MDLNLDSVMELEVYKFCHYGESKETSKPKERELTKVYYEMGRQSRYNSFLTIHVIQYK